MYVKRKDFVMRGNFIQILDKSIITPLIILLITIVASFIIIYQANDRSEWVEHTHIVIEKLESLISDLKDAETGARGYQLTRDTTFSSTVSRCRRQNDSKSSANKISYK